MKRSRLRTGVEVLALAAVYVVVARLGLMVDAVAGFATLVWPPTGIALAAVVLWGPRMWPGVALGAFAANLWAGAPLPVAAGIAVGNTLEALLGGYALRRIPGFQPHLGRVKDVVGLIAIAALGATTVSATVGTASLWLGGVLATGGVSEAWRAWWLGDAIGALVVAPALLTWSRKRLRLDSGARALEAAGLGLGLIAACVAIASVGGQAYLIFPLLIWAALRFGQRGAATFTLALAAISIVGTAAGYGPFVRPTLRMSLFELQAFLAVVSATFLVLGAAASERRRFLSELADAVHSRDALISVASHELRTPLSALSLQVEVLMRQLGQGPVTGDVALPKLTVIQRQVVRLTKLIEGLLEVSRISAGKLQLELEEMDLAKVVRDVVGQFDAEVKRGRAAPISVEVEAGASTLGRWDHMRVEQVVTNLVSNAVKYGEGKPIEVTVGGDADRARVVVRDHGVGIAAADQPRIFEPFERLVTDRKAGGGGFGLGLWIVRQIVAALDGTIRVASAAHAGATFVVELPRRPAIAGDAASPAPAHAVEPDQVLVVEDDVEVLEWLRQALRARGYDVVAAADGRQALELLQRGSRPQLILLDLRMPVMDGREFLAAVAHEERLAEIPVVLLSADGQVSQTAAELQVSGYIQKPVDEDTLLSVVQQHVHREGVQH